MMNKFFIAVGQITVGVVVGSVASTVWNKFTLKPVKNVDENKEESK